MNQIPPFDIPSLFRFFWLVFTHGGWLVLTAIGLYMAYYLYKNEIQHQFVHSQEWVFLNVKGPKDNLTSTLAVEQIFQQLHVLHVGLTFAQKYIEGMIQLWYSFEMISMGGKISMIIRVPKSKQKFVESAIYSEYPAAEISVVEDYMKDINYDPEESDFDLFGTEFKLGEKTYIPIKTYRDFEHPTAENPIIDPLAPIFEGLSKIEPHEFYGIQIIAQPTQDEEWKPQGERYIKELTGEEVPHEATILGTLLKPFDWFAHFSFKSIITGSGGHDEKPGKNQKNDWMSMTDIEKLRVNSAQSKMGKSGYKVKIRHLYIAPKDKFDKNKRSHFIGAFRSFGSAQSNKLKPDVSRTWTAVDYIISPDLEKPYMDWIVDYRKKMIFKGYKDRDIHIGLPAMILNSEELATLYHWPLSVSTAITPSVEKVESKKVQAPSNLPI